MRFFRRIFILVFLFSVLIAGIGCGGGSLSSPNNNSSTQPAIIFEATPNTVTNGVATILTRDDLPGMARFQLRTTRELARFIAAKGSVTLDGVSLTVNTVDDVAFSVLIIPHTLNVTTLGGWRAGGEVNLKVDLMARYAARLAEMK